MRPLILLGLLLLGSTAFAAPARPISGRLRLTLPGSFEVGAASLYAADNLADAGASKGTGSSGNLTLVGGSLALSLFERVVIEGHAHLLLFGQRFGGAAGVLFTPFDHCQPGQRGWMLQIPLQAGYQWFVVEGIGDSSWSSARVHLLTLASGLDATYWYRRHLGIDFRLLVTGLARLGGTSASRTQDRRELRGGVGIELEIGLAF